MHWERHKRLNIIKEVVNVFGFCAGISKDRAGVSSPFAAIRAIVDD